MNETVREQEKRAPVRRVGTFTVGVTLVAAGVLMLLALCFPELDLRWALRLTPLPLIGLGVETLLYARGGEKLRYDWVGMLLSCLLVGAALTMCAAAWCILNYPEKFLW